MVEILKFILEKFDFVKILADYSILGVIAYFFLKSYIKREDIFKKIMEDSLDFYRENTKELKTAIDNLSDSLIKNNEVTKQVLSDIVIEVDDLKDKYNSVTKQVIETILDDRKLSKRVFFDVVKLILSRMNYKIIISANALLDANGLVNQEKIEILKLNILNDMKRYKEESCQSIIELDFDKSLVDTFLIEVEGLFEYTLSRLNDEVFEEMVTIEKLPEDHNYFNIKQKFKNIIYDGQSECLVTLKDLLK